MSFRMVAGEHGRNNRTVLFSPGIDAACQPDLWFLPNGQVSIGTVEIEIGLEIPHDVGRKTRLACLDRAISDFAVQYSAMSPDPTLECHVLIQLQGRDVSKMDDWVNSTVMPEVQRVFVAPSPLRTPLKRLTGIRLVSDQSQIAFVDFLLWPRHVFCDACRSEATHEFRYCAHCGSGATDPVNVAVSQSSDSPDAMPNKRR